MATPIRPDYSTQFLLPPSIEDWVPLQHPARFIREFVDSLNLVELGFSAQPCLDGRPPYSNELLLKVWLMGYFKKIRSSRALEEACHDQMAFVWLTGNQAPDHNTLWRFWKNNKKALRQTFKKTVDLALSMDLVGFALQAVDGTKIQAVASSPKGWTREHMEELLQAINGAVDQTEACLDKEAGVTDCHYRLPEDLAKREKLKEAVEKGLQQLEQTQREHYHRKEPEAARMKCPEGNRFGYNAQAVADQKAGIVTAIEVNNHETDHGMLTPMIEKSAEQLGKPTATTLADAGYGNGADLQAAEQANHNIIVPAREVNAKKEARYRTLNFKYDSGTNTCVCPENTTLHFERNRDRRGLEVKVFRCQNRECPVRHLCTTDPKGRMIEIGPYYDVTTKYRQKLQGGQAKEIFKKRKAIIEPIFAIIKQELGFRRWTVRGLENVKSQWALLCATVNLIKIYRRKIALKVA